MGKRGFPPQPTALKIARGNPGKRPLNHEEPQLRPAGLKPPVTLKGKALEEWERLGPDLVDAGVLTVGDLSTFETYCRLVGQEAEYQKKSQKHKDDATQQLRYDSHLLKIRAQKKQYAAELGLTPSSRSGVKAKKPKDQTDDRRRKFGLISSSTPQQA
jgi:P27 family predicted phage terminase small subunit